MFHFFEFTAKYIFYTVLLFYVANSGFSQVVDGYIIDTSGHKVNGYLKGITYVKSMPVAFLFSENEAGEFRSYSIDEILEFSDLQSYYFNAFIKIETSPSKSYKLDHKADFFLEDRHVFIKRLVSGKKPLYMYRDEAGNDNFYIRINGEYVLLMQKEYIVKSGGRSLVREITKYREQLNEYLNNYLFYSENENIAYNEKELSKLVYDYNRMRGQLVDLAKPLDSKPVSFALYGGLSITSLQIFTWDFVELRAVHIPKSTNLSYGLSIDWRNPDFRNKSFRGDLGYINYITHGSDRYGAAIYNIELQQTSIHVNCLYQQKTASNIKYQYFNSGVFIAGIVKGYSQITRSSSSSAVLTVSNKRAEIGLVAGAGIVRDNFMLEVRYMLGNGILKKGDPTLISHRFILMAGYVF